MVARAKRVVGGKKRRPSSNGESLDLELPSERNSPPEDFLDYVICLYGKKGIGKTTIASSAPDSVTFMFERGRRNLPIFQIPKKGEPALDWARFKGYLGLVVSEGKTKRVVVDTIDKAYEACFKYICEQHGVENPDDAGKESYKVWNQIRDEFEGAFDTLHEMGIGIIFTSHCREKKMPTTLGEEVTFLCPTCTPSAWRYIQSKADFVFLLDFKERERCAVIRGNAYIEASCQVPETFLDPQGNEINTISLGKNGKEGFGNLLKGFANKLYDVNRDEEDRPRKKKRRTDALED